ncbi:hypothetical protein [Spiroplasma endosymbiont of Poecilobothrus nobilitatus]|uniref:hypothetical protein n=1 Tax=Spiroplasma endosymbiont of Poecilobothrus nobilitatus TaxID=1209220 RepID=UPI00313C6CED
METSTIVSPLEQEPSPLFVRKTFGKAVTTVETLLKNRQQQINFEFNNSEKDKPKDKSIIKEKSRTKWLKEIEQAPAGTIKVGLRNVSSNNHEQTMQKVDFKQIKNKSVTKAKFKKDLAIDETKELQLTIHDILDKSKKYIKNQSILTDF